MEEAIQAGITEMIFITSRNKRSIEDHFDKAYELETELEARNKKQMLELVQSIIPKNVTCIYIRQTEALGLGHAVLYAQSVVGNEPFAVILADDLVDAKKPVMQQMVEEFDRTHCSILGVQNVARAKPLLRYRQGRPEADKFHRVESIVEKPKPEVAPSTLGVVGPLHPSSAHFRPVAECAAGCWRRNPVD